jgi:hypothetical protein
VSRRTATTWPPRPGRHDPEEAAVPWYGSTGTDLVRRFTLGSGPLKRGSDHVEFVSRLLLVSGLSTTGPVGLAVATVSRARTRARAAAQAADHPVVAVVGVPAAATAAAEVVVLLDRAGHLSLPPPGAGDAPGRAVGQGLRASTALALAAVGAHLTVRALLDRSRSRRWAAEWAAVEPVWTGTGS